MALCLIPAIGAIVAPPVPIRSGPHSVLVSALAKATVADCTFNDPPPVSALQCAPLPCNAARTATDPAQTTAFALFLHQPETCWLRQLLLVLVLVIVIVVIVIVVVVVVVVSDVRG